MEKFRLSGANAMCPESVGLRERKESKELQWTDWNIRKSFGRGLGLRSGEPVWEL